MAILTLTGLLVLIIAGEFAFLVPYIDSQRALGIDHGFYKSVGERWLDTGEFYLPHQLEGSYVIRPNVDNLYPPIAIPFFAALRWLPFPLWWIIPMAVVAAVLWRLRPAPWTWPILLMLFAWPRNVSDLLLGNSNQWVIAAVAAGVVLGWPAVFVALKPSLGFFALIGIRRRSWWIAAVALAVLSLLTLDLWRQYGVVVGNSDAEWYYSLEDAIPMSIPLVAWLGRRDGGFPTLRALFRWRPTWPLERGRTARQGRALD